MPQAQITSTACREPFDGAQDAPRRTAQRRRTTDPQALVRVGIAIPGPGRLQVKSDEVCHALSSSFRSRCRSQRSAWLLSCCTRERVQAYRSASTSNGT